MKYSLTKILFYFVFSLICCEWGEAYSRKYPKTSTIFSSAKAKTNGIQKYCQSRPYSVQELSIKSYTFALSKL
ncbi:hypothetical protein ACQ9BO_07355 [Flavobacterium sp. P21]|uniref:hypothetical protein n=1 Tax=Flavobacterium sp. P21 TaxID=3423948 RepID=UPI003D67A117